MRTDAIKRWLWPAIPILVALMSGSATAQNPRSIDTGKARVVDHWTPERKAKAIPRDLAIDPRGLGYMRRPDGSFEPYGHDTALREAPRNDTPWPFGKVAGGSTSDTTPPTITSVTPASGATIGASYTFSAKVTDASGVRSVTFKIQKSGSTVQSFSATKGADDNWSASLQGFTNGDWSWSVVAKDGAAKGGNTATLPAVPFKVDTGSAGGSGTGDTVTNARWTAGGAVQTAAGRLYFEMPGNKQLTTWWGYVCSGTVVTDSATERSIILTAAHCVYDDVNKVFARNVMFIPNQAGTKGSGTDRTCSNDPLGCWVPDFGVVDTNWTTRTFPDNVKWDYAFYVVRDSGAHSPGLTPAPDVLDTAAGSLAVNFGAVTVNDAKVGTSSPDFTYALGYSYSDDPKFMYCAEDMTGKDPDNWWLPNCGLSGGSSGGLWVQPPVTDPPTTWTGSTGSIVSVNSWGYTNSPGMAGPKLNALASCVFDAAKTRPFFPTIPLDGQAGVPVSCP